jgi:hypothetical protein
MKLLKRLFRRKFRLKKIELPKSLLAVHMDLVTNGGWLRRLNANKRLGHYMVQNNIVD